MYVSYKNGNLVKQIILKLIKVYQSIPKTPSCRYIPSCSEYSYEAIDKYGIISGVFISIKRLLRCHPLNTGGFDPLPK